jgi:hypothetical protein
VSAEREWNVVLALGVGLSALFLCASIARGSLHDAYFSADHLYIPTLVADLTRWHGHFSDWNLTPAPYLFPDMLLYGVVSIFARNLEASQYLTGFVQLTLVILSARILLQRLEPEHADASALVAPLIACWLVLYHFDAVPLVGPALIVSAHGGALLSTLVVFALCVRPAGPVRAGGTFAVVVLSALTAASDALFVVCSSIVLGLTALGYLPVYLRMQRRESSRLLIGRCSLAALAGIAALCLVRATGFSHTANTSGSLTLALETVRAMWNDPQPLAKYVLVGFGVVAVLAGVTLVHRFRDLERAGLRILAGWQLLIMAGALGAMLYTGAYEDLSSLRYLSVPCYFGVIFATALLLRAAERSPSFNLWPQRTMVALTLALVFGLVAQISAFAHASFQAPQRTAAACVRELAEREQVQVIVSDYWTAKPLMLLTDNRAHVVQVRSGLMPYWWINSRGWYRDPGEFGLLIANGLNPERARRYLHDPQTIVHCGELELWVYRGESREHMSAKLRSFFAKGLAQADAH